MGNCATHCIQHSDSSVSSPEKTNMSRVEIRISPSLSPVTFPTHGDAGGDNDGDNTVSARPSSVERPGGIMAQTGAVRAEDYVASGAALSVDQLSLHDSPNPACVASVSASSDSLSPILLPASTLSLISSTLSMSPASSLALASPSSRTASLASKKEESKLSTPVPPTHSHTANTPELTRSKTPIDSPFTSAKPEADESEKARYWGQQLEIVRTLRDAIYGKIKLAKIKDTGEQVVMKMSCRSRLRPLIHRKTSGRPRAFSTKAYLEDPLDEARYLSMVNGKMGHPNVLKLLDHYFTATHHVMILEFCSNDEFFDRISREGRMADQQARAAFRQIASGLHHIHSSGVAHLDMSLENVLIDHEGVYKICDFGMAREIKPEPSKAGTIKQGRNTSEHENDGGQASRNDAPSPSILRDLFADCEFNAKSHKPGKIGYQAPEIFRGLPFNGRKADVWSLGIILFITLVGAPPFTLPAPSDKRYRRVIQGQLCSLLRDWGLRDVISDDAVDLLNHMLCPIVNRYTLRQVLAHKWVTGQGDKEQLERLI